MNKIKYIICGIFHSNTGNIHTGIVCAIILYMDVGTLPSFPIKNATKVKMMLALVS